MSAEPVHLLCSHCGDRIGVYERYRVRRPDGSIASPSSLDGGDSDFEPFHEHCAALHESDWHTSGEG